MMMKTILQIVIIMLSFISVQAQYTLSDDEGNPIANNAVVTATYDMNVDFLGGEFHCNVLSENTNNFRFQILTTDQAADAENWVCTNFGTCYSSDVTDIEIELLDDQTRQLQLHYMPGVDLGDVTIKYRITEVGNTSNTITFNVKFVEETSSIIKNISSINKFDSYPNPANQFAKIVYDVKENSKIYLYNILGEMVETYILNKGSGIVVINTSELKSGIYTYKLIGQSGKCSTKYLIVNH